MVIAWVGCIPLLPRLAAQDAPQIVPIKPAEKDFFTKELIYKGIPIKTSDAVADAAMLEAYKRVSLELGALAEKQPVLIANMVAAGVEVHIIGQHQVTSDLPEFSHLKGKPLPEYHGLTIDERTRGMGGRLTSCGEENLLKLPGDRYRGRDICIHEFAHAIRNFGMSLDVVDKFNQLYQGSLARGLWKGAYAATNADEFFAELSMWYFGTHGDMAMAGAKPAPGPEGLKAYDADAFKLFDDFYSGRIAVSKNEGRGHEWTQGNNTIQRRN